jgi:hypothetical protein
MFRMFGVIAAFALVGCESADTVVDCSQICNEYQQCIDGDEDVGECVNHCNDHAEADEDFEDAVDVCENCLDDADSCLEGGTECLTECAGVVAAST